MLAELVIKYGDAHMRFVLEREAHPKPSGEQMRWVMEAHGSDEVEIDEDAYLSEADNGYWVSGWLWVAYPTCDYCGDPHDPEMVCDAQAGASNG
jgi:hypothetical protein